MTPTELTERIAAEALRLFAERGYDRTSIRDVAGALGISPGNLTYHFPKKPDLFKAAIEGPYVPLLADLDAAASLPNTTARERLRAVINRLRSLSPDEQSVLRIALRELLTSPEHLAPVLERFRTGHPRILFGAVQAALAEGGLPKGVGLGVVPIIISTLVAAPMVVLSVAGGMSGQFDFIQKAVAQSHHDLLVLLGYEP